MNPLQAFCTPLHPLRYIQLSWLLGAPVLFSTTYNYHVYWEPLYYPPLHTIIMFIGSPCTPLRYIQLSCLLRELLYYPPLHTIIMFIGSSCTILRYIQLSCLLREPLYSPPLHTIIMFIGSPCQNIHCNCMKSMNKDC